MIITWLGLYLNFGSTSKPVGPGLMIRDTFISANLSRSCKSVTIFP